MSLETQLSDALTTLNRLRDAAENLHGTLAGLSQLQTDVNNLLTDCAKAREELLHPVLRLATFGTTSSGKSTVVNALAGHSVAPVRKEELSAGILRLIHGSTVVLTIRDTPKAIWECGEWRDIDIASIQDRCERAMRDFHEVRKTDSSLLAPDIQVTLPLYIMSEHVRARLGVPEGIQIELVDLPGLSHANDRKNLHTIQGFLRRALGIVVLDFNNTDETRLNTLLLELQQTVAWFGAGSSDPDGLVFIYNRIDQLTLKDRPIDSYLGESAANLRDHLGLQSLPTLVPTTAILGTYAVQIETESESQAQATLSQMLKEAAKQLEIERTAGGNGKRFVRALQDAADNEQPFSEQLRRECAQWAWDKSGMGLLLDAIRRRIEARAAALLILPAVERVLDDAATIEQEVRSALATTRLCSKRALEESRDKLQKCLDTFRTQLGQERSVFIENFKSIVNELKNVRESPNATTYEIKARAEKELPGLGQLIELVGDVKNSVLRDIVMPIKNGLIKNSDLLEKNPSLKGSLPHAELKHLQDAYERFREVLGQFQHRTNPSPDEAGEWVLEELDSEEGRTKIENAERRYRALLQRIREALDVYANSVIQGLSASFIHRIEGIVVNIVTDRCKQLEMELPDANVHAEVAQHFAASFRRLNISLPEKLFDLPQVELRSSGKKTIEDGTENYEEEVTSGTCLKTRKKETKQRAKMVEKSTLVLTLPDASGTTRALEDGIDKSSASLWTHLMTWVERVNDQAANVLEASIKTVSGSANEVVARRIAELEEEHEVVMQRWRHVEFTAATVDQQRTALLLVAAKPSRNSEKGAK